MSRLVFVIIILIALLGLSWFLSTLAYGIADSEETKVKLVTELRQFEAFTEHETLLLDTVDREHETLFEQIRSRSRKGFNWDGYRDSMYLKLIQALVDAGEQEASTMLDRFRAGT